jgi:DNA polymerase-1
LDIPGLNLVAISLYAPEYGKAVSILFNFSATYFIKVKDPHNARRKIDKEMYYEQEDFIEFADVEDMIIDIFKGADVIAANGKFDIKVARKYNFYNFKLTDDTVAQAHHLDPDGRAGLKQSAKRYLGITMTTYEETVGQKANNIDWTMVDWDAYGSYSCNDALITYYLAEELNRRLEKYPKMVEVYKKLALPITEVVADMEYNGVKVDVKMLKSMSSKIHAEITELEETIYDITGVEFNIGSSKQLGEIMFDRLNYPVIERTEKGARAVGESVLKELDFRGYKLPKYLLTYRKLVKLQTTYIDAIPEMISVDGLLHANFNVNATRTSRFSSSNPNLQNQPNNKQYPVRKAFIPRAKDRVLLVGDHSQIELRILAHFSKDKNLTRAFIDGLDLHQQTADNINNLTGLHLSRSQGKTLNFATVYLMSPDSLMYRLNADLAEEVTSGKISEEEYNEYKVTLRQARQMINGFFNVYSGVKGYINRLAEKVKEEGRVYTLGGFGRPIPELRNKRTFSAGRRLAINTKIQGSASDVLKMAMVKIADQLTKEHLDAKLILQVHDELVYDVKGSDALRVKELVRDIAENVFPGCSVPLLFDIDIFHNWAEMKAGKDIVGDSILSYILSDLV